ncbi:hypothetical protein B0H13DRAFT_2460114 [Mycena leptocephala]|nr:hypothetical protein B0H13DRAFT_2460114 [Mycena leptocephala]
MPSTLLHREWIEQLAVRWLTPPVVDVLERGAYTSPLTRAGTKDTGWIHRDHSAVEGLTTLTLLAGAMSPFPYCSDGRDLCFLRPLLSLSQSCAFSNLLASSCATSRVLIVQLATLSLPYPSARLANLPPLVAGLRLAILGLLRVQRFTKAA